MHHPSQAAYNYRCLRWCWELEAAPHVQVSNKGGVEAVKTSDLSETLPTAGDGGVVV